jgi:hypothetical protein
MECVRDAYPAIRWLDQPATKGIAHRRCCHDEGRDRVDDGAELDLQPIESSAEGRDIDAGQLVDEASGIRKGGDVREDGAGANRLQR